MIIDRIENAKDYFYFQGFQKGLEELQKLEENPKLKRYDFEGGYFFLSEGDTMPADAGDYEAHKKYIDIQYILDGCEEVVWANAHELEISKEYQQERDIAMYQGKSVQINTIKAGMFWIALPQDAHKPARHSEQMHHYKKAVFKLPYHGDNL